MSPHELLAELTVLEHGHLWDPRRVLDDARPCRVLRGDCDPGLLPRVGHSRQAEHTARAQSQLLLRQKGADQVLKGVHVICNIREEEQLGDTLIRQLQTKGLWHPSDVEDLSQGRLQDSISDVRSRISGSHVAKRIVT